MTNYLGLIIEQSLRDPALVKELPVIAVRRGTSWVFLLLSVPEAELDQHIGLLQSAMVADDNWYAHYFRGDELIVVYRDAHFRLTTDPASCGPAAAHGLAGGIPQEQLDFHPRTLPTIEEFFGTKLT